MWFIFFAGIILSVVGLFIYGYFRLKYIQAKQRKDFLKVFGDWKNSLPTLEFGSSYGWTTFKVIFQNKSDLEFAIKNKLTDDFKKLMKLYYNQKFDADIAVYFTYKDTD